MIDPLPGRDLDLGAEGRDQVVVVALAGGEDPQKSPVLPQEFVDLDVALQREVEQIRRVLGQAGVRRRGCEERLAAREEGLDELLQRRLLALEVEVERALGDTASAGDLLDLRARKALLCEDLFGRAQEHDLGFRIGDA